MKLLIAAISSFFIGVTASAQIFTGGIFRPRNAPTQVPGPTRLEDFVFDGKLRLGLEDAITLALLNNTDIRVNRAQNDLSPFAVQRAQQPFDPLIVSNFSPTRSVSPSASTLAGASTLSTLNQTTSFGYSQQFQTGTALGVNLATTRATTNSS